jgi:hypothetical protein
MHSDFQSIDLNDMEMVNGGGVGSAIWKGVKATGQFVKNNWQGIVSAADLAYSAARDLFGGQKKE